MSSPNDAQDSASGKADGQQPEVAAGADGRDTSRNMADEAQAAQENVQEKISNAADSMADRARNFTEQQKRDGAERVDDAATAVHRAADEIAKQSPLAGRYMHAGARQLDRASRILRENSLDELYRMTNRLAHDRPLAFIGGSVAAGFVLARVLRSSGGATMSTGRERAS
jgi:hypothetical protein